MLEILAEPQRWAIPAVFIVSAIGAVLSLWWERRRPTSYTRQPGVLGAWRGMTAAEQEAVDTASLDLAEQAELDAKSAAEEAAQLAVERAVHINTLTHP